MFNVIKNAWQTCVDFVMKQKATLQEKIAVLAALAVPFFYGVAAEAALVATDLDPLVTEVDDNLAVLKPFAIGIMVAVLGLVIALGLAKKFTKQAAS